MVYHLLLHFLITIQEDRPDFLNNSVSRVNHWMKDDTFPLIFLPNIYLYWDRFLLEHVRLCDDATTIYP